MTSQTEHDEFVGLPEVAERLGIHRATVNDMVRSGRLPATRDGAHWLVRRTDLEDFASAYVRPSNAPTPRSSTLPSTAPKILELLAEFESASVLELTPLLAIHEGNVRKHLRLMEVAGLVTPGRDAQWRLTDRGTDVVGREGSRPTTSVA